MCGVSDECSRFLFAKTSGHRGHTRRASHPCAEDDDSLCDQGSILEKGVVAEVTREGFLPLVGFPMCDQVPIAGKVHTKGFSLRVPKTVTRCVIGVPFWKKGVVAEVTREGFSDV